MITNKTIPSITFTYRLQKEKTGYSVKCLDWNIVYSQGETKAECKQNMIELTSHFLEELFSGKLVKEILPVRKKHKEHPLTFSLEFNLMNFQPIKKQNILNYLNLNRHDRFC